MGVDVANGAQDIEPPDFGHAQIDHDEIGTARLDERNRLPTVGTSRDVETRALGKARYDVENPLLVVDYHQQWSWIRHAPPTLSRITAANAARSARK